MFCTNLCKKYLCFWALNGKAAKNLDIFCQMCYHLKDPTKGKNAMLNLLKG